MASIKSKRFTIPPSYVNDGIAAQWVMVISNDGSVLGKMAKAEAIAMAKNEELDLVVVSPNVDPPVCRIMNFGKYRYEINKKQSGISSGSKKVKELTFGVAIADHDLSVKINHAKTFISAGHHVRCAVKMRGRELMHKELAIQLLQKFADSIALFAKLQDKIVVLGNIAIANFIPNK